MSLHTRTELVLDSPRRLKAIADETRSKILRILGDDPASAKELSSLLEMSHGKVGHHLKVLRDAGFIDVVEERPVRAVTERFYGLTYDSLSFAAEGSDRLQFTLTQAAREALPQDEQPFDPAGLLVTARMSRERAGEFMRRLADLAEEFWDSRDNESDTVFGLTSAVFLTDTPQRRQP